MQSNRQFLRARRDACCLATQKTVTDFGRGEARTWTYLLPIRTQVIRSTSGYIIVKFDGQVISVKPISLACTVALALCLSTAAFSDDLTTVNPVSLGFSTTRLARIGAWYRARAETVDLTGAVVAIARGDKLVYFEALGFQDRAKTIPMKPDSIFWIASMTKPITSVAAMLLVEEGKLGLDAPVAQYLPELKDMPVGVEKTNPATGNVVIAREPPERPMTVRDLLRHTSGLVYPPQYTDAPINRLYRQALFQRDNTLADFVASLADLPLAHQPGNVWEYSWGADVLARVVEVAKPLFDRLGYQR